MQKPVLLSAAQKNREDSFFISAENAKIMSRNKEAITDFDSCLRIDRSNGAACYELSRMFESLQNPQGALTFAIRAASLDTTNRWYRLSLADALVLNKQYRQAEAVFAKLHLQYPSNLDYLFNEGVLLSGLDEYDSAREVFDEIEQRTGVSEQLVYQQQLIDMKQGKVEAAAGEIGKLIRRDPYEPRYYGLLAQLYIRADKPQEAFQVYRDWLQKIPYNPQALIGMALYFREQGHNRKYEATMAKAFANPDMDVRDQIAFVYPYLRYVDTDSTKKQEALMLCRMIVRAHPSYAGGYRLFGDMLLRSGEPDSALVQYHQALSLDGSKASTWQQVLLVYAGKQQDDSLLAVSERVMDRFPDDFMGYYFNGAANIYLHQFPAGIVTLTRALAIGTADLRLMDRIYILLGNAYMAIGNFPASDSCMEKSLAMYPDDPLVLNNYSYNLAERDEQLPRAEKMSSLAVSLEPGNYAFEDTYAWVLFRLGRYRAAKKWMEKSLKDPRARSSPGYLEHYGDILYRLNRIAAAEVYWRLARLKGGPSPSLDRKIDNKKLSD